jgi:hypothetical protein
MQTTEEQTRITLVIIFQTEPWRSMAGFNTKKKGIKYFTKPNCIALNAVLIGSEPAKPAPAKAERATGGVIYDGHPHT